MRIFAKQFITTMCVLIVSFMVLGNMLVFTAFETTMNRETGQNIEEMKIFQYAMLASLQGLPKDYQAVDQAAAGIVRSIQQNLYGGQEGIVIYNEDHKVIYQDDSYESVLLEKDREGHGGIWQITVWNGHHYLESLCEINSSAGNYILEIHRNIDYVYRDRDRLYERYRVLLGVISAVFAVVIFLVSLQFARPIRKLSQAARLFADGDYKKRVREKGNDEVTMLSRDFNRMADQLEESIGRLEEEARRQEEFTSAFSHELKTPLTSIIGYADILRARTLNEEERSRCANYIVHQGRRLERLSLKMLEMSYVDKQETAFLPIEVSQLVRQIRAMTEAVLEQKSITMIDQVEPGVITGDMDLLLSLFGNLIDNARKACENGGEIFLSGETLEEGYRFVLRDNGCGMPEDEIQKITEPFYMIDKSRARKEGGAGIGMALCQKIISIHQAEWKIESTEGEGTSIRMIFPTRRARERKGDGR